MSYFPQIKAIFKPSARPTGALIFAPKTKLTLALIQVNTAIKLPWKWILGISSLGLILLKVIEKVLFRK